MPINRETLRGIKKLDNEKFLAWLTVYARENYEDGFGNGVESNTMAIMRYLHDEFGWGNTRFSRLVEYAKKDVQAMREGYVTPADVKNGLAEEGVTCLKQLQMKNEPDPLQEWVPVEVTLPPEEEKVLCCTMNKKGAKNLVLGYYADGDWRVGMNSNVIAWRFLPPAYEAKEEKKSEVK